MGGHTRQAHRGTLPAGLAGHRLRLKWVRWCLVVLTLLFLLLTKQAADIGGGGGDQKQLSAHYGPLLRLLLLLAEPSKWKLVAQLGAHAAGQPAAQALQLMALSAVHGQAERLVVAAGSLALALHAAADTPLLGACVAVAALPLQGATPPPPAALRAFALGPLLRVPALTARVATAASRLGKDGVLWARVTELGASLASDAPSQIAAPDDALCIAGNLLSLLPAQPPPTATQLLGLARLVEALLVLQPTLTSKHGGGGGGGGGGSWFHQLRGWTSRAAAPALAEHLNAVATQLAALWSPRMLSLLYTDALAVPLGAAPADSGVRELSADGLQMLAARAQTAASLHLASLAALPPQKPLALARLAYATQLVASLWALLRALDAKRAVPLSKLTDDLIRDPLGTALAPPLLLFLEAACHLLPVIADKELHEDRTPFAPSDLAELVAFLNRLAFRLTWELGDDAGPPIGGASSSSAAPIAPSAAASTRRRRVRDLSHELLALLADKDARRPFCDADAWLVRELRYSELHREFKEGKPRARRLLSSMPWAVPFERRVNVFRELIAKEKGGIPNEALPEHMRGHRIKIRRGQLLEDGYVQMGNLSPEQLKGTIRVEFVNEYGLAEAGIDRDGVFKEFMEDTAATAFDPNRGLFKQSDAQMLYPSASSESADPSHLRYFEFVGRMLGKAVYEGIVLDVPLADFFILKLLNRQATLDELPSLDPALAQNLDFLKRYEGDVEADLCLDFSIDVEDFRRAPRRRPPRRRPRDRRHAREPHRIRPPRRQLPPQRADRAADQGGAAGHARDRAARLAAPLQPAGAAAPHRRRRRRPRRRRPAQAHALRGRLPRVLADGARLLGGPRRVHARGALPLPQVRHVVLEAAAPRLRAPAPRVHGAVRAGRRLGRAVGPGLLRHGAEGDLAPADVGDVLQPPEAAQLQIEEGLEGAAPLRHQERIGL